jgi:hypothetical protein
LSPDSLDEFSVTGEELTHFLDLGMTPTDKFKIGRMRDSDALRLFSPKNCLKCLTEEQTNKLMYLLPWSLQEKGLRNLDLPSEQPLEKAVGSFKLRLHDFNLSLVSQADGVSGRFHPQTTQAVTVARDSAWLRVLNCTVILIQFIMEGDDNWSFACLGTHYLQNFFGFVRQSSRGHDGIVRAIHVIARVTVMLSVIHELELQSRPRRRANVGQTTIGRGNPTYSQTDVDKLCFSFLGLASLHFEMLLCIEWLAYPQLVEILRGWCNADVHHESDPVVKADFARSVSGRGMAARNLPGGIYQGTGNAVAAGVLDQSGSSDV